MASIKHSTQANGGNNPRAQVSESVWNEDHTLEGTPNTVLSFDATGAPADLNLAGTGGAAAVGEAGGTTVQTVLTSLQASSLNRVATVSSRANMAAISAPTNGDVRYLTESKREGLFVFDSTNISANVSAGVAYTDTAQGVYVLPLSDTTGASGAWVRKPAANVITPYMFGATGGYTSKTSAATGTNDRAAIQAMLDFFKNNPGWVVDFLGLYWRIDTAITLQVATEAVAQRAPGKVIAGRFVAGTGTSGTDLVTINLRYGIIEGKLGVYGSGDAYATRGWVNGLRIVDSAGLRITDGIEAEYFKRWGIWTDTIDMAGVVNGGNNIGLVIGKIHGWRCGSAGYGGSAPYELAYTFDSVTRNGVAGSTAQTSTVHFVETLDSGLQAQDPFLYTEASGRRTAYTISSVDFVANTITFHHWLPSGVTAGTMKSAHGGMLLIEGANTGFTTVECVTSSNVGCVVAERGLYGSVIKYVGSEASGINYLRGENPSAANYGGWVGGGHSESTYMDWLVLGTPEKRTSIGPYSALGSAMSGTNRDALGQIYKSGPRYAGDDRAYGQLKGVTFKDEWGWLADEAPLLDAPGQTPSVNITLSNRPHERMWRQVFPVGGAQAITVNLDFYPDYAAAKSGKHWMQFELFGTGNRNEVTSVTVQLPAALVSAGYTLNGGTAALVYTDLPGPCIGRAVLDTTSSNFKFHLFAPEPHGNRGVATNGDVAATLAPTSQRVQVWNTPLTANRAVTLSITSARAGDTFKIVRTAAATGAFNLNVGAGPLKALAAGQWCEVTFDGSAWLLSQFGSL